MVSSLMGRTVMRVVCIVATRGGDKLVEDIAGRHCIGHTADWSAVDHQDIHSWTL